MSEYVVIERNEAGGYSAWAPDLPGVVAAASSYEETLTLMREAVTLHLEGLREDGQPIPAPTAVGAETIIAALRPGGLVKRRLAVTLSERLINLLGCCWANRRVAVMACRSAGERGAGPMIPMCDDQEEQGAARAQATVVQADTVLRAAEGTRLHAYITVSLLTARAPKNCGRSPGLTLTSTGSR